MIKGGKLPRVFAICALLMFTLTLLCFHPHSLHTLSSPHKPLWNYLFTYNISHGCLPSHSQRAGGKGFGNAPDCTYDSGMTKGCSSGKCSAGIEAKDGDTRWEMVKNLLPPGVTLREFNNFLQHQASDIHSLQ